MCSPLGSVKNLESCYLYLIKICGQEPGMASAHLGTICKVGSASHDFQENSVLVVSMIDSKWLY